MRHTFGSLAINRASIVQVQHWMGHADIKTTMRYLHHKSRADEAEQLAGAFSADRPLQADLQALEVREAAAGFHDSTPYRAESRPVPTVSLNAADAGGT